MIEHFTAPGDWVFDPFAGGGTTLVESLALGRNALGIDISQLAAFVSEAKTLRLSERDHAAVERWIGRLPDVVDMHAPGVRSEAYANAGYYRNIQGPDFWRLRKAIEQSLASVVRLRLDAARTLARCVVLRTAQWALDAREQRPSIPNFRSEMIGRAKAMLKASLQFTKEIEALPSKARPTCLFLNRPAAGANEEEIVQQIAPPKLILTSPPYPGVHVLYHRWQVDGRREAPAPFWIANKVDGAGSSYYTMGDRKYPELRSYFEKLEAAFSSIAAMAGTETTIVQMVAFSEPAWQLPRYLEVMERCGLSERTLGLEDSEDGRLWRDVPNRKWHLRYKARGAAAREVVLIHRRSSISPSLPDLQPAYSTRNQTPRAISAQE